MSQNESIDGYIEPVKTHTYNEPIFKGQTVGAIYDVSFDTQGVIYFNPKKKPCSYCTDFQSVEEWKRADFAASAIKRSRGGTSKTSRFDSLSEFKEWYQKQAPSVRSVVIADLVMYLNKG